MPRVKKLDLGMTALDELFMNDKERAENKLPKIFDIPLSEIDDFPGHPYRVLDDEDMQNLMESIKDRGVITPAMVRKKDDGRYEMISGHRRKHASERLGLETLRCEVVEVSRDEAIILMVDSNAQRSVILPCDKGRAYKMKLEAIKRQGQRTDLTSRPVGEKLSVAELAEDAGDSERQIHRYIRLTYLVDELQDFVDKGQMKMRPAVELSYLDEETQRDIVDRIDETEAFPSHDQAIRIRKAYEAGEIDYDKVRDIMAEEKPNQKPKFKFSFDRLKPYIPKDYSDSKAEDYAEALALIKANLAYAVTGDETNLDLGAIEKRIKEATKEMENYMVSYRNTGGDKTRYLECIQKVADEIKSLRAQEATAKAKHEKSTEVNSEIKRLCDWLDSHDTSFSEYDDMVIRRVVECIKVFKDGTIKVITKFGTEATETV